MSIKKTSYLAYTKDIKTASNYAKEIDNNFPNIVFSPITRTAWFNGAPYGSSYATGYDGSSSYTSDVFGNVFSHSISSSYSVAMGENNKVLSNDALAIGSYNYDKENSYIFMAGNGTSDSYRSNAFSITKDGYTYAGNVAKSNVDTCYVSSLGENAYLDTVLSALLKDEEYRYPVASDFVFSGCGGSCVVGTSDAPSITSTLSFKWKYKGNDGKVCKPIIDADYIKNYVTNNNAFPNGYDNETLATCGFLRDYENNTYINNSRELKIYVKNIEVISDYNEQQKNGTTVRPKILSKLQPSGSLSPIEIYNGKNDYTFQWESTLNPTFSVSFVRPFPGEYPIVQSDGAYLSFCTQTPKYYSQLMSKGTYVQTTIKTPPSDIVVPIKGSVYAGYNMFYGIFTSNTLPPKNVITRSMVENGINSSKYAKRALITKNNNSNYLPKSNTKVFFGKNKMGVAKIEEKSTVKYFYLAFPTEYINANNITGKDYLIEAKTSGVADPAAIANIQQVDFVMCNDYTAQKSINYTAYCGILNIDTINFGDENESSPNIRMNLNRRIGQSGFGLDTIWEYTGPVNS